MGDLFLKKCSHYKPWLIAKQNKQKQRTEKEMSTKGTREEGTEQAMWRRGGETGQTHKMPPPRDGASSLCGLLFLSRPWSEYGTEFPLLMALGQSSRITGLS